LLGFGHLGFWICYWFDLIPLLLISFTYGHKHLILHLNIVILDLLPAFGYS
jgi:hypothetical protein